MSAQARGQMIKVKKDLVAVKRAVEEALATPSDSDALARVLDSMSQCIEQARTIDMFDEKELQSYESSFETLLSEDIDLDVTTIAGDCLPVRVCGTTRVENLKMELSHLTGRQPLEMVLTVNDQKCENGKSLWQHGLIAGTSAVCNVVLTYRQIDAVTDEWTQTITCAHPAVVKTNPMQEVMRQKTQVFLDEVIELGVCNGLLSGAERDSLLREARADDLPAADLISILKLTSNCTNNSCGMCQERSATDGQCALEAQLDNDYAQFEVSVRAFLDRLKPQLMVASRNQEYSDMIAVQARKWVDRR